MKLELISWNTRAINAGNYKAYILAGQPLVTPASGIYVDKADVTPELVGVKLSGPSIAIQVFYQDGALADEHLRERELKLWFQTNKERKGGARKLLAQDTNDSNRQWSVMGQVISVTPQDNSCIVVIATKEPYWKVETQRSDITWNPVATASTHNLTVVGDFVKPIFKMTPRAAKGVGFLNYRFVEVQPPSTTLNLGKYWLDISGVGGFDTQTLVSGGDLQASGNDFRVLDGNSMVDRYFGNYNTTATKIWTCLEWKAKLTFTLGTAIAGTGDIDTITVGNTALNKANLPKMPSSGILKIGTERFTYSGINIAKLQFTGVKRASKQTTESAHLALAVITWIQHDLWFVYNNPTIDAPIQDDTRRPMFDLDLSTNILWVLSQFYSLADPRSVEWTLNGSTTPAKSGAFYSVTEEGGIADPATALGITIPIKLLAGVPKTESGIMNANLYCAAGFTHIANLSGKRYRQDVYWPVAQIKKSKTGTSASFTLQYTIASPSTAGSWADTFGWGAPVSLSGNFPYLQLYVQAAVPGKVISLVNNKISVELNAIGLTVDVANVPTVTVSAELETYWVDQTYTNNSTDEKEWLHVQGAMKLDEVLTIDCARRVAYHQDGTYWSVDLSTERPEWLVADLPTTEFKFEEVGVTDVDITILSDDRAAL